MKFKQDRYLAEKGGSAAFVDVICAKCGNKILLYQKDEPRRWLRRCYLNRIFAPEKYEGLQRDKSVKTPEDMPDLKCEKCNTLIGTPMKYKDGRLAFVLVRGSFRRRTRKTT